MKLLFLLVSALSCCAGVSPNALHIQSSIPYRFGPVAYYSPGSPQNTMNGMIRAWGDSLTVQYVPLLISSNGSWNVFDGGVGGDTSTQVATRFLADTKRDGLQVFWVGRNNYSDTNAVMTDLASMVAGLTPPKRFLILSVPNGEYAVEYNTGASYHYFTELRDMMASSYPGNFFDIRASLIANANGSAQDLIDVGHDIVPDSLRADPTHLNALGYSLVVSNIDRILVDPAAFGCQRLYDLSGSAHHLDQAASTSQPFIETVPNGCKCLTFDGVDDYLKATGWPLVKPTVVIGAFDQISWTAGRRLFDGDVAGYLSLFQKDSGPSPLLGLYAGAFGPTTLDATLGTWFVISTVSNGADSSIQLNNSTPVTGNAGTSDAGGFTLGTVGSLWPDFNANMKSGDIILFDRVLTAPEQSCLVQWLGRRNGINVW